MQRLSVGNFRMLSLGICQTVNVYSSVSFWTEESMCACVENHCFNSTLHWKTYRDANLSSIPLWLKSLHLISLWISLLSCCYSIHKHLSISEALRNFSQWPCSFRCILTHMEREADQTEVGVPGKNLTSPASSRKNLVCYCKISPYFRCNSEVSVQEKSWELSVTAKKLFWVSCQSCCFLWWAPVEQLTA